MHVSFKCLSFILSFNNSLLLACSSWLAVHTMACFKGTYHFWSHLEAQSKQDFGWKRKPNVASVTRFDEIWPFLQNLDWLWQFLRVYCVFGKYLTYLTTSYSTCNGPKLNKNLAIWPHWTQHKCFSARNKKICFSFLLTQAHFGLLLFRLLGLFKKSYFFHYNVCFARATFLIFHSSYTFSRPHPAASSRPRDIRCTKYVLKSSHFSTLMSSNATRRPLLEAIWGHQFFIALVIT